MSHPGTRGGQRRRGVVAHVTATWPCTNAWHRAPHESASAQKRGPVHACMGTCWSWPVLGAKKLVELEDRVMAAVPGRNWVKAQGQA